LDDDLLVLQLLVLQWLQLYEVILEDGFIEYSLPKRKTKIKINQKRKKTLEEGRRVMIGVGAWGRACEGSVCESE